MNLKLLLCDDSDLQLKKTTNFVHSCLDTYTSFTSMIVPYKPEELEKLLESRWATSTVLTLLPSLINAAHSVQSSFSPAILTIYLNLTKSVTSTMLRKIPYRNICLRLWIKRFSLQLNERHAFWTLSQTGNDTLFHATRLPISNGSAGRSLFIPTMGKPIKYTNPFRL